MSQETQEIFDDGRHEKAVTSSVARVIKLSPPPPRNSDHMRGAVTRNRENPIYKLEIPMFYE